MVPQPSKSGHAIVIGGSIAGLLAAHVLSGRFARVTVIERDLYSSAPAPRKGVPQSAQLHILLRRGALLLEEFFPGLDAALARAGAPQVDWMQDLAWYTRAGWAPRSPSSFQTRTSSLGLLEHLLLARVWANPKIEFIQQIEVIELVSQGGRICGVRGRPRGKETGSLATMELRGDLVVDASGRGSRAPRWLSALGLELPDEWVIDSDLGYVTRTYRPPENFKSDWKTLLVSDHPPFGTRGGMILPIENGQWMVNLVGAGLDNPPVDEAGFLEFARSLVHPELYDSLKHAEPLSPPSGYRRTANRLARYDQVDGWPEGFLVMGDAFCTLNPLHAQGISVAALEARALESWLAVPDRAQAFQKRLARLVRTPWMIATSEDLRIIHSKENRGSPVEGLMRRYLDEVQWLAGSDKTAFRAYLQVKHMTGRPAALFNPWIIWKVLPQLARRSADFQAAPAGSLR